MPGCPLVFDKLSLDQFPVIQGYISSSSISSKTCKNENTIAKLKSHETFQSPIISINYALECLFCSARIILTIKHCDRTKVKTITVKNFEKLFKTC